MTTQPRTPRKARSTARSPLLQAVHETAADLDRHGFIDKRRMQKIEALCLKPVPDYDSARIRALRERL